MDEEEALLRTSALENVKATLAARHRAEQALEHRTAELARSLALVRATLESSADGILVTDQGSITDLNERYLQMWPVPADIAAARDHYRLLNHLATFFDDPQRFLDRVHDIYATAPPETHDVLELTDGRTFERVTKMQVVEGQEVGRVWSFRDISDRRRAEEALRDETRVLEILNRTGAAVASELDVQTVLQSVTDAATELSDAQFGAFFYRSVDERGDASMLHALSGAPPDAFEDFGHPRATPLFGPTFRGAPPIRVGDLLEDPRYGKILPHYGMQNGHPPMRSYLAVPVMSRNGGVLGGLFFGHAEPGRFTERSERLIVGVAAQSAIAIDNARLYESERAARTTAERLSEMKDRFLANLSHELRTPLNAVQGWAQILRRGFTDQADLHKGLEAIERNARIQSQLINDLLDMSRISSGKVRLDIQPVAPVAVVEAALETVRPAADAKEIRLVSLLDRDAGPVSGDPARLQQVVWNLLANAIKFTPKGGTVHVTLERVDSHIHVSVTDTGIGIDPEFVPFVFERFQQGDSSTTKAYGGLGLGLSIVKHLVEMHGGTVTAASPGQHLGSTFTIHLPLTAVRSLPSDEDPFHPQAPSLGIVPFERADLAGVTVLVVDDDQDARDMLTRLLSECGATVLSAATADEAMALFTSHPPDILVSDIGMPDVDGYELLARLRASEQKTGRRTPAVALTAFARSEDRIRTLRAGFVAHVAKPVEPSELVATLAAFSVRRSNL